MNSDLDDIADALTASIAADGQTPITAPILGAPGTVSLPAWSFAVDPDTGWYRVSSNVAGVTAGGTLVQTWAAGASEITGTLTVSSSATIGNNIVLTAGVYSAPAGTAGAPAYTFAGDLDSGFYRIGANNIGVAVNGAKILDIATTGLSVTGTSSASTGFKVGANPTAVPGKTPTFQEFLSGSGTYTPTAGTVWIRARVLGGGGGSGGSAGSATSGGSSAFNGINANGGSPGANLSGSTAGIGGAGGSGGSGTAMWRVPGANGGAGTQGNALGTGGQGGASAWGGGAGTNQPAAVGLGGATNSGGGASGHSGSGGGGGGEYFELFLTAAAYTYAVGAAGAPATNGASGGAGRILVEEYYS